MLASWIEGKIIKIESATAQTKRFWIEIPSCSVFEFTAGQFITLDLPIHEQKNKRWRSYSIASAPTASNIIELVVVWLEGGLGSTYLCQQAQVGTILLLRGPQGKFVLHPPLEKDIYLICTGTGIAPFRSMVWDIYQQQQAFKAIHLIFGCRTEEDLLYYDEMKDMEERLPNFYYHPILSRAENIDKNIPNGYVHKVYEQLLKNALMPAQFYLCGWKNMIDEAKQKIIALGYEKTAIHLELYG